MACRRVAVFVVLAMLAAPASASSNVLIYSEHPDGFSAKPKRLGYVSATYTPEGATVSLRHMHWHHWGSQRSRGRGRGKICAPMSSCPVGRVTAIAKGRFTSEGGRYYKTLVVKQGDTKTKLCVNPEVCA